MSVEVEDLGGGVKIVTGDVHRFGTDAFLLADFAAPKSKERVCDLCSGCGIVALLMARDYRPREIVALELQREAFDQLSEGVRLSSEEAPANIFPVHGDLKEPWELSNSQNFHLVTANPPYSRQGSGIECSSIEVGLARHELACTTKDLAKAANKLLRFGGRLAICQRPDRLGEVISEFTSAGLEPKRLRFVTAKEGKAPWLFLLEAKKGGKPGLTVLPQLVVYKDGVFTEELKEIYRVKIPKEV